MSVLEPVFFNVSSTSSFAVASHVSKDNSGSSFWIGSVKFKFNGAVQNTSKLEFHLFGEFLGGASSWKTSDEDREPDETMPFLVVGVNGIIQIPWTDLNLKTNQN